MAANLSKSCLVRVFWLSFFCWILLNWLVKCSFLLKNARLLRKYLEIMSFFYSFVIIKSNKTKFF